jgi:hypothetical protein
MNSRDISLKNMAAMLHDAAELGAKTALTEAGLVKPYISKSQAVKMAGRASVNRWVQEGLITLIKDGPRTSKIRINRVQFESVMKTSNRHTYLTLAERMNNK